MKLFRSADTGERARLAWQRAATILHAGSALAQLCTPVGRLVARRGGTSPAAPKRRPVGALQRGLVPALPRCVLSILVLIASSGGKTFAADKVFNFGAATLTLQEVTGDVEVRYQSMRLNRALNVWNVEAILTNRSGRTLQGPFALSIESYTGTTGPLQTDGLDGGGKLFYDLSGVVLDGVLATGEKSLPRTLALGVGTGAPSLVTKVFAARDRAPVALALARTLNEAGQPLPETQVDEIGPVGSTNKTTEPVFGVATLGQGSGNYVWKFSHADYLPVWRQESLSLGEVTVLANPRLTRRSANVVAVTPIGGGQLNAPSIRINVSPGAFAQNGTATLTPLTGQTLPALLPQGWSPMQAFWLETSIEPALPVSASLLPWGQVNPGETVALVRWNETSLQWEVKQLVTGNGTNAISATLSGSGAYALVVGDVAPQAPPAPQMGQPLQASAAALPDLDVLTATGSVNPPSIPASRNAELVTATATVVITNRAGPMPSGLVLRCEVSESYRLQDGSGRHPPQYENFVIGYQRPGDANASTLQASFPLRPLLLFGGEELAQAVVGVEVLTPTPFSGGVLDGEGGLVASDGLRVLAGAGDILGQEAAQVRRLNPTNFTDLSNIAVLAAFDLSVAGVAPSRHLVAQVGPLPTNGILVLARVLYDQGLYGVQPLERLSTDAAGKLSSAEPLSGEKLEGISGAGQYLLLRLDVPQGLVSGIARNSAGQPAGGLPVRVGGEPWLAFSETNGVFRLLAPVGNASVAVTDFATGDTGLSSFTVTDPQTAVVTSVSTAPTGPRVLSTSPTNGAVRIPRVTPITIEFSEPVNPGTLLGNALQLVGTNGQPVAASLTLNLRNTVATLLPTEQLDPSAVHTIVLSTNITDLTGLRLEGTNRFTFTTLSDALNRGLGAQVVSYEPTNGVARVEGTQGIADPEAPVILVNETTGRTSTVLSKPDGSFAGSIRADVDDFLSAVFVNQNGTRNTIPVSRQIFRDGSVGLFKGGGILEAQSEGGPVQVIIEPAAIPNKTVFKIEPLTYTNLLAEVKNTPPDNGQLLGGFHVSLKGDPLNQSADVSFPVKLEDLQIPPGSAPELASFALAIPKQVDGVTVYEIIDRMHYENGRLVTHSLPFSGLFGFGLDFLLQDLLEKLLVTPIKLAVGSSVAVSGKVASVQLSLSETPIPGTERPLPGARITFSPIGQPATPGRLRPGTLFATAGPDGKYAIMLPRYAFGEDAGGVVLRATHPRFPGIDARRAGTLPSYDENYENLGNGVQPVWDLFFPIDATLQQNDVLPPDIFISQDPHHPAVGNPASIRIVSVDNTAVPNVSVILDSVTSLIPDINGSDSGVTLQTVTNEVLGATSRRTVLLLNATNEVRIVLKVTSVDDAGNERSLLHPLRFGGPPEPTDPGLTPSDGNDQSPPSVVFSNPVNGAKGFPSGNPIIIRFNEAIDRGILQDLSAIQILPAATVSSAFLTPDQQELSFSLYDLRPDTEYTVTLTPAIKDISGNPLDQYPTISGANSFVLHFHTAALPVGTLSGIEMGGGGVVRGNFAFVLERKGQMDGGVIVYNLSNPSHPEKVIEFSLPGYPRDLALIPSYSFKRRPESPVETKDLLAVMGGKLGENQVGQYLWILDVSDPQHPARLAAAAVNLTPSTAVTKIKWSPPNLGYLETDVISSIGLINIQTFILGAYFTSEEFLQLPAFGREGRDLNGDGDYVDPGEELPLPASRSRDVMGKLTSYTLPETDQFIRDFDISQGGALVGVALEEGNLYSTNGTPSTNRVGAAYRTLVANGALLDREPASVLFTNGLPARVHFLNAFPAQVEGELAFVQLALISLQAPPEGTNKLVVIDVTEPLNPKIVTEIPIPKSHGDGIYSVIERENSLLDFPIGTDFLSARENWSLALATTRDLILLDPFKFFQSTAGGTEALHPAIVGIIPGAGRGAQTMSATFSGYVLGSQGGRNEAFFFSPSLQFVGFPTTGGVVRPETLVDHPDLISLVFSNVVSPGALFPARFRTEGGAVSTLSPAQATDHYHVVIQAPGAAGPTIQVALESLNRSGHPLKNKGLNFPAVRAVSQTALNAMGQGVQDCDVPVRPLTAFRLSSDTNHPNFNLYLSKPFALTYEKISLEELAQLVQQVDREILWSGFYLRASLDTELTTNAVLGQFAAQVDPTDKTLVPGLSIVTETFPASYIMGPNPPSAAGHMQLPGSLGTVAGHNGEFRSETVDMLLPGRRLPIEIVRTGTGQDLYDGPFGRSWDFNYNQQLVELRPAVFRVGSRMPLVLRGQNNSEIAGSRDVVLQNGAGRNFLFTFMGTNAPPEFASDPLAQELGWLGKASSFYLPPGGLFEMMVRFKDGKFARLTSDGTQFWYSDRGRLETIYDRHPKNSLRFNYNARGELLRVTDESASDPRFVDFGYWRLPGESLFQAGLDTQTTNTFISGKICKVKDYTGRDVLFYYTDDGLLERREGPEVTLGHADSFLGRSITRYLWDSGCGDLKGILAGNEEGTPIVSATLDHSDGTPVVKKTSGSAGTFSFSMSHSNSAAALQTDDGHTEVTAPDGASSKFKLDRLGLPTEVELSGYGASNTITQYKQDPTTGLTTETVYPEKNSEESIYDTANPNLRSRGNLLSIVRKPGPRGGEVIPAATFSYDNRYNMRSGEQKDFNGNSIVHELTPDGRETKRITHGDAASDAFEYNEFGQITRHITVDGLEVQVDFDGNGFSRVERHGAIEIHYDFEGNAGKLGLPTRTIPGRGEPIQMEYNERNELITRKRGAWQEKRSYDENGNLVRISTTPSDGAERIERRKYNHLNFLTELALDQVEVDGAIVSLVTTYEPDSVQRIKRVIFPGGEIREFDYDHLGHTTRIKLGDHVETYSYDLNGNMVAKAIGNATNFFVLDGYDRVILTRRQTQNGFEDTHQNYYGNGELKRVEVVDPVFGTIQEINVDGIDALGREKVVRSGSQLLGDVSTVYSYDPVQRLKTVTNPRQEVLSVRHDSAGRVVQRKDSLQEIQFVPDENGNVFEEATKEENNTYTISSTYNGLDYMTTQADDVGPLFAFGPRLDGAFETIKDGRNSITTNQFTILGENRRLLRPNGVEFDYAFNKQRSFSSVKDAADKGRAFEYDSAFRLTKATYRDGSVRIFSGFDPRNNPTNIVIPGGSIAASYDPQGRLLSQRIDYNGVRTESFEYDALDRIRRARYQGDEAAYNFDKLGPLVRSTFTEKGETYVISHEIYEDGLRKSLTYPSGIKLQETRGINSRLESLNIGGGGVILSNIIYEASDIAREKTFGAGLFVEKNTYDLRKRLLTRRYERAQNGNLLAEIRYSYDAANHPVARQEVHRNGRTDFFVYDSGGRLIRVDTGARPQLPAGDLRTLNGFVKPIEVAGTFSPGFFARTYHYDAAGLDLLTQVANVNPDHLTIPAFATNYASPNLLLHIQEIDGFDRGSPDPLGNTIRAKLFVRKESASAPQSIDAMLTYNGNSQLLKVERSDGVVIENDYQHTGLRYHRRISQSNVTLEETAFIYDAGLLIEERTSKGTNQTIARYYYDERDVPVAADFQSLGQTNRYYLLTDGMGSVVALVDSQGEIVERVAYDPFGQPTIELADRVRPRLAKIVGTGGDLLFEFSEPVLPPLLASGTPAGLLTSYSPTNGLRIESAGSPVAGTLAIAESVAGFAFGTVWRFHPDIALSGSYRVALVEDGLIDSWNNGIAGETNSFNYASGDGVVLYANAVGNTAPVRSARSAIGSPFLFHGQYFDYDSGLVYMRARYFDPFSGMFLQPDPDGYEDSVNLYAGFRHNPQTFRDPSGRGIWKWAAKLFKSEAGRDAEEALAKRFRRTLYLGGIDKAEARAFERTMRQLGVDEVRVRTAARGRLKYLGYHPDKPVWIHASSGGKGLAVISEEEKYVSDLDLLDLRRAGKQLGSDEVVQFREQFNKNLAEIWKRERVTPLTPASIQHGAQLNLGGDDFLRTLIGNGGKSVQDINNAYVRAVPHPGDSITLRLTSKGRFVAYDTPSWTTHSLLMKQEQTLKALQSASRFLDSAPQPAVGWDLTTRSQVEQETWRRYERELMQKLEEGFFGQPYSR